MEVVDVLSECLNTSKSNLHLKFMTRMVILWKSHAKFLVNRIYSDGFDAELVFNECDWLGCVECECECDCICDWWKPGGGAFVNQQPCGTWNNNKNENKRQLELFQKIDSKYVHYALDGCCDSMHLERMMDVSLSVVSFVDKLLAIQNGKSMI